MNSVLHTALQALSIMGPACILTAFIINGAVNEAVRPRTGVFFPMLVPYHPLPVKKCLDCKQGTEPARSCTWSMAVAGSLFLLVTGARPLLNGLPGEGKPVRLPLFQPLDFLEAAGAPMRFLLLIAAYILAGLVSGIRPLYHRCPRH